MKRTLIITVLSCIALASLAFAADVRWTNAVAGTLAWENAGNWTNNLGQAAVPALSTDWARVRVEGVNATIVYSQTTNPIYGLELVNFNSGSMLTLNITNAVFQTIATNTGAGGDGLYMNNYVSLDINSGGTYLHNGIAFWNGTININNGGLYSNIYSGSTYQWQAGNPKTLNVNSGGVWFANCGVNMGYNYANQGTINLNKGGLFRRVTDGAMSVPNRQGIARFNINGGEFVTLQATDGENDNGAVIVCNGPSGNSTDGMLTATDAVVSNRARLSIVGGTAAGYGATGVVNIIGGTWNQHNGIFLARSSGGVQDVAVLNIMSNATVVHSRGQVALGRYDSYGELNVTSGGRLFSIANGDGVCLGGNLYGAYINPRPAKITVSGNDALLECRGWALRLGVTRGSNTLVVANGGTVVATQRLRCSDANTASNNTVTVANGFLYVTNASATAELLLQYLGTFDLSGGTAVVDKVIATQATTDNKVLLNKGLFVLKGDALDLNNNINRPLVVGNGVDPMTLRLDRPTRVFFNSDIVVTNNGVLQMLNGVTNQSSHVRLRGGTVAPGASVGTVWFENYLTLENGATYLCEKSTNGMDKINCGTLTINTGAKVTIVPLAGAIPGGLTESNVIIQASSVSGFANLQLDLSQTPSWTGALYQDGTSVGVILMPEPAVLGLALLGLLALRKR